MIKLQVIFWVNIDVTSFSIIEQLNTQQVGQLHDLCKQMWWSTDRTMDEVLIMLKNCMSFGLIENDSKQLIGYARVLTDEIKYAFIFDLMIAEHYRDQGLGKMIMNAIINHPKLKNITQFELTCLAELISYYEQFNFSEDFGKTRAMRLSR